MTKTIGGVAVVIVILIVIAIVGCCVYRYVLRVRTEELLRRERAVADNAAGGRATEGRPRPADLEAAPEAAPDRRNDVQWDTNVTEGSAALQRRRR
ncbi:hypothetical protein KEM52_003076 [Ascosphaera acerosa]|nr:hypothetical protein KEM52_003076 [Ascosphaera acerosa]